MLRVVSRLVGSREDIMKQSVRKKMEEALERVIPADAASDFNQGLIERLSVCPMARQSAGSARWPDSVRRESGG